MTTVVCFGDSNTWGYVPGSDGERFPREVRWPVQPAASARRGLGGDRRGAERSHRDDRAARLGRAGTGLPYLLPCLHSHAPVDLVVIFLGTNDVNFLDDDRVAALRRAARRDRAGGATPSRSSSCPPPFDGHDLGASFADWSSTAT